MADVTLTPYGFVLPEVGASEGTWGTKINANWTTLDGLLDGTSGTAISPNLTEGGFKVGGVTVTSTAAELNLLDGVTWTLTGLNGLTSTVAELNILDGVTATAAEINAVDGVTATGTSLIRAADAAAGRTALGLGALATVANVTTSEIAAATLVTEAEGIASNDNDTTLPTSAAVKDYADGAVATNTAALSLGAVGSYAWLVEASPNTTDVTAGSTYSGSVLRYHGAAINGLAGNGYFANAGGGTPSGTWRAMGHVTKGGSNLHGATLFLRIS